MGMSKIRKRRKRRQLKARGRPVHRLRAGRTGTVRFKQRAGMLREAEREKK